CAYRRHAGGWCRLLLTPWGRRGAEVGVAGGALDGREGQLVRGQVDGTATAGADDNGHGRILCRVAPGAAREDAARGARARLAARFATRPPSRCRDCTDAKS